MPTENKGLLSIKEFSQLTGIKQSTLRYYDKLGIFSPAYRGENGYRRYQPFQLIAVSVIDLLHGFGLKTSEVRAFVDHRTPQRMQALLTEKQDGIEAELKRLSVERDVAATYNELITRGLTAKPDQLTICDIPERRMTIGPLNDFSASDTFERSFSHFYRMAKHYGIDLRFPVGGYFDNFEAFQKTAGEPSHFFSVDPQGKDKIPAGKYLVGYTIGAYGETHNLEVRMTRYLKRHELEAVGPVYNIFLLDEISLVNSDDYLMEAFVQIK
ncbi:MAG: MerR family DNA-binding transcriptional regulator [Actinomycetia bacterium]|nr:MerR family DNA-binding transcriptional regulator [Actinomycetes bacterium]